MYDARYKANMSYALAVIQESTILHLQKTLPGKSLSYFSA